MDENDHTRDVYAYFGVSLYYAQVLEHGLVNTLVTLRLGKCPMLPTEVDALQDSHFESTLGTLIKELKAVVDVPHDLQNELAQALKLRNWLAHDYFRERAEAWFTETGRDSMLAELKRCRDAFKSADAMLEKAFEAARLKLGITDARLEAEYALLLQRAKAVSGAG